MSSIIYQHLHLALGGAYLLFGSGITLALESYVVAAGPDARRRRSLLAVLASNAGAAGDGVGRVLQQEMHTHKDGYMTSEVGG